jgi:molybdopterin-biosynthesis enzyme MoeA-like protein
MTWCSPAAVWAPTHDDVTLEGVADGFAVATEIHPTSRGW